MALQRGEFEVQRAREHSEWLEVEGALGGEGLGVLSKIVHAFNCW